MPPRRSRSASDNTGVASFDDDASGAKYAVDSEHQSAQALVQLAQSGLGFGDNTANGDLRPVQRQVKSQLTSQQIHANATLLFQARRLRWQQKKQARKAGRAEAALAWAELQSQRSIGDEDIYTTPDPQGLAQPTPLPHSSALPASSHPLDDVSTDDEVEIIGLGTEDVPETVALPEYSEEQRRRAMQEVAAAKPFRARKRRKVSGRRRSLADQSVDPDKPLPSVENTDRDDDTGASDEYAPSQSWNDSSRSAQANGLESAEMIIDPILDESAPAKDRPQNRTTKANRAMSAVSKPSAKQTTKLRKHRRPRRAPIGQDQDTSYISPYIDDSQNTGPQFDPEMSSTTRAGRQQEMEINDQSRIAASGQETFGDAEFTKIEQFRDSWCEKTGLQATDFNDLMQSNLRSNKTARELFAQIQELFPSQKSVYLQRFCRRKFHNFAARGTWTKEEDGQLLRAVAEKGTSWKNVGHSINRFPEDCRDRWRNYLSSSEAHNHDMWTEGEIRCLARHVYDNFYENFVRRLEQEMDETGAFPDSDRELNLDDFDSKHINWQWVSDHMANSEMRRTRLQCSYKWGRLKEAKQKRLLRAAEEARKDGSRAIVAHSENNTRRIKGWRGDHANREIQKMLAGDKMDLLEAILACGARSEQAIKWSTLGPDWFQQRWTTYERRAAWLALKDSIQASQSDDYRDLAREVLNQFSVTERDERWIPDAGELPKEKEKRKKKRIVDGGDMPTVLDVLAAKERKILRKRRRYGEDVIEIPSDEDEDVDQNPSMETSAANYPYQDDSANSPPQTQNQMTAFSASATAVQPYGGHELDLAFEQPPFSAAPAFDGDLSPTLTRRVLQLQDV